MFFTENSQERLLIFSLAVVRKEIITKKEIMSRKNLKKIKKKHVRDISPGRVTCHFL